MSEAALQHRPVTLRKQREENGPTCCSRRRGTLHLAALSQIGQAAGVPRGPPLSKASLSSACSHRPGHRRRRSGWTRPTLVVPRPVLPPSGATPLREQWWCGPAWGGSREQEAPPLAPVLPLSPGSLSGAVSGAVRWDTPKACGSGSKPHSAHPPPAEQAPWGAADSSGRAWGPVLQGVHGHVGHFRGLSVLAKEPGALKLWGL